MTFSLPGKVPIQETVILVYCGLPLCILVKLLNATVTNHYFSLSKQAVQKDNATHLAYNCHGPQNSRQNHYHRIRIRGVFCYKTNHKTSKCPFFTVMLRFAPKVIRLKTKRPFSLHHKNAFFFWSKISDCKLLVEI